MTLRPAKLSLGGSATTRKARLAIHTLFRTSGERHPHLVFVPEGYEPGYAYPLLVWLHSPGVDEEQLLRIMPHISLRNFLAVAPRGLPVLFTDGSQGFGWPQSADAVEAALAAVLSAVDAVCGRYNVGASRIYLAGFADGGTMALRVALSEPRRFAGAASLCGPFPRWGRPLSLLRDQRRLSLLLLTGNSSQEFSIRDACQSLKLLFSAGMNVILRQYPCGDQIHQAMLADINRWIIGEVTGQRAFVAGTDAPRVILEQLSRQAEFS